MGSIMEFNANAFQFCLFAIWNPFWSGWIHRRRSVTFTPLAIFSFHSLMETKIKVDCPPLHMNISIWIDTWCRPSVRTPLYTRYWFICWKLLLSAFITKLNRYYSSATPKPPQETILFNVVHNLLVFDLVWFRRQVVAGAVQNLCRSRWSMNA